MILILTKSIRIGLLREDLSEDKLKLLKNLIDNNKVNFKIFYVF